MKFIEVISLAVFLVYLIEMARKYLMPRNPNNFRRLKGWKE